MKKWLLRALYVLPVLLVAGLARSDYTLTQGAGSTVLAFVCQSTKICPASALINSAGTEIATAGAPLRTDPTGTTVQPVSGVGSVFPSSQSGIWSVTAVQPTGTNLHIVCDSGCAGGGGGGTSSNFGSAYPAAGTAGGMKEGANMTALNGDGNGNLRIVGAGITIASTTVGQTGSLVMGAVTTASPAYSTSQSNPLSLDANGGLRTNCIAGCGAAAPASTTSNIAPNNTTAVIVKASAGTLYGIQVYGIGAAPAYLKIYNAASATCGAGTPVKRIMIPSAATGSNGAGSNVTFGGGIAFSAGITYCVTTGLADADTTAPAAATYLVNIDWG